MPKEDLAEALSKVAAIVADSKITYDDMYNALSQMTKSGYSPSNIIMPPNIYGAMFDIPFQIKLKNGEDVRIRMSEVDEFMRLYHQEITECKDKKDFIEKIAVIRL